jgi:hypothetical protein
MLITSFSGFFELLEVKMLFRDFESSSHREEIGTSCAIHTTVVLRYLSFSNLEDKYKDGLGLDII